MIDGNFTFMNTNEFCKSCRKPKAIYDCGICHEHTCKSCTQFMGEDHFSFLKKVPKELTHTTYCPQCFEEKVREPFEAYNHTMEQAKEILFFTKEQTKMTSKLKRNEEPYHVENCEDQDEALMRMSFFAVQGNFNALIDVQFHHKKIIVGSHKKTVWSATAIPVSVDPNSIRDYSSP